ncbi:MAG: imidazole glycerol phosphate synthase subunit HisH [Alphaproteobacteria bacterium]|nr:imidazole glycerol phosphate synthase subunit HisH [Alphaproteobacteria bacterium]
MTVAIVDYGSGNLRSAANAFERVIREHMGHDGVTVSADPVVVAAAERVVLPGVGAFADCHSGLAAIPGMLAALQTAVIERGRPFLGICVGMQLMASRGLEHGIHLGLDWIGGEVTALKPAAPVGAAFGFLATRLPHMGWNELVIDADHPVLHGIRTGDHAYFVHSFGFRAADPAVVLAHADHGGPVTAVIGRANLVGTQFHPEKSQTTGLRLIANFLAWQP